MKTEVGYYFERSNRARNIGRNLTYLSFFLLFLSVNAFSELCDPAIHPSEVRSMAYRDRGNRCEGLYSSVVSAGSVDLVNLTKGYFSFKFDPQEMVHLSSSFIQSKPINVRAVGIPIRTYYRMDTLIRPGATVEWPIKEVIYPGKLSAMEIGIFGWIKRDSRVIYVPVSTASKMQPVNSQESIILTFRASINVENVQWRYYHMIDNKCSQASNWTKSSKESYRSGQPINIILPQTQMSGMCIELAFIKENRTTYQKELVQIILKE